MEIGIFVSHFDLNIERSTPLCIHCSPPIYKFTHAIFIQLTSGDLAYTNGKQVDIHPELIQLERGVSVWARLDVQFAD